MFHLRELFYDYNKKLGRRITDMDLEGLSSNWGSEGIIRLIILLHSYGRGQGLIVQGIFLSACDSQSYFLDLTGDRGR